MQIKQGILLIGLRWQKVREKSDICLYILTKSAILLTKRRVHLNKMRLQVILLQYGKCFAAGGAVGRLHNSEMNVSPSLFLKG